MKDSDDEPVDDCTRILQEKLEDSEISETNKDKIERAIAHHNGTIKRPLSLPECLSIARLAGDSVAVRLDDGLMYRYIQFDDQRSRVVLVEPSKDETEVPVEETNISDVFDNSTVDLVTLDEIETKRHDVLTVVTHDEYGSRIVFGDFPDGVECKTSNGFEMFEMKTQFPLPESMTPSEIKTWLNNGGSHITDIVNQNDENDWGENAY